MYHIQVHLFQMFRSSEVFPPHNLYRLLNCRLLSESKHFAKGIRNPQMLFEVHQIRRAQRQCIQWILA